MKTIEVYFNRAGNTVVGNYSAYLPLLAAIERKSIPSPNGYVIAGESDDMRRLAEYVELFGHCIRSFAGWRKACELGGVTLEVCQ